MPALRLLDLRDHARPDLLAGFVALYGKTFNDPSEREDPAQWPPRLYGDLPAPQPRMHLLVAVDDAVPDQPLGGIAFEYYRDSRCGLLAVISLLQIKGVIAEIFGWQEQNPGVWLALTAGIVILAGIVWWSYHKGLPRRIVNRTAGRS